MKKFLTSEFTKRIFFVILWAVAAGATPVVLDPNVDRIKSDICVVILSLALCAMFELLRSKKNDNF